MQFRQYKPSDLGQVRHLHEVALRATNAFGDSGKWDSDLNDVEGVYINKGGNFIVGLLGEEVVAMGAYKKVSDDTVEIKRMRVRPELQGRGLGRKLLTILESEIEQRGYAAIVLDTTVNQLSAQKLYVSSGYKEVRREIEGWPLEMIFYRKDIA